MTFFSAALLLGVIAVVALVAGCVDARAMDLARRVRGRLALSIGVFAGVALASWWVLWRLPALSGVLFMISPGVAAAIGVCIFGLVPFRTRRSTPVRTASLTTRTPQHVITRRTLTPPVLASAVLAAALLFTGFSADSSGVALPIAAGVAVGPYPGWFYGVPILVTTVVLLAATAIAVRRTLLLPAADRPERYDERWRLTIGATLGAIVTCGLLLYLAEIVWTVGRSFASASHLAPDSSAVLSTLGLVLVPATLVPLAIAVAVLVHAGLRLRRTSAVLQSQAGRS